MLSSELRAVLRQRASRLVCLLDLPTPACVLRLEIAGNHQHSRTGAARYRRQSRTSIINLISALKNAAALEGRRLGYMKGRSEVKRTWMSSQDYVKLRRQFDGSDRFMQFPNVVAAPVGRRGVPEWMKQGREAILKMLREKFPKANKPDSRCDCLPCRHPGRTDLSRASCDCAPCKHTTLFLKWYLVIFECFIGASEGRKTGSQLEREYGWKYGTVDYIAQQIRRWKAGDRLDGKPRTGRNRGRPRKDIAQSKIAA